MFFLKSFLLSLLFLIFSTKNANAIIVIVPVVLVPIVSIVVWIIGALATPVIALSTFYFKTKKKSPFLGMLFGLGLLLLLGVLITIVFKIINPDRQIFNANL
jgi:hypothetical protein